MNKEKLAKRMVLVDVLVYTVSMTVAILSWFNNDLKTAVIALIIAVIAVVAYLDERIKTRR